eukprot:590380-Pelagomonas_calceolata.AAC.3
MWMSMDPTMVQAVLMRGMTTCLATTGPQTLSVSRPPVWKRTWHLLKFIWHCFNAGEWRCGRVMS